MTRAGKLSKESYRSSRKKKRICDKDNTFCGAVQCSGQSLLKQVATLVGLQCPVVVFNEHLLRFIQ